MNKIGKWLWGLVLVVVGVVLGLNALGVIQADIFFPGWWTLFIIVPCAIDLLSEGTEDRGDHVGSVIGVVVGGVILFGCLGVIDFEILWKLVLPVILVVIGAGLIWGGLTGQQMCEVVLKRTAHKKSKGKMDSADVQEAEVVKDAEKSAKGKAAGKAADRAAGRATGRAASGAADRAADVKTTQKEKTDGSEQAEADGSD